MTRTQPTLAANLAYLSAETRVPAASVLAIRVAVTLSKWTTRRRTRLALSQLNDHQLRDVGLTRDEASCEARRVFWRA